MARRIPYQLIIKERKSYLYIEFGGVGLTLEALLDMVHLSAQAVRTLDAKRVLLVRNTPLLISDADRAMFGRIVKNLVSPGVRFAMVDKFGNDPAKSQHGLEVLRTAGWEVSEFPTLGEAKKWLAGN